MGIGNTEFGKEDVSYVCGGCGRPVHAKVVAKTYYDDLDRGGIIGQILWCTCPCMQPTILKMQASPQPSMTQWPVPLEFTPGDKWPPELERLFAEASLCFSAKAFTACAMCARKILMLVAHKHGDGEGKKFAEYVDYIIKKVVTIPTAKDSIDAIRKIGNDANHDVAFVDQHDARRAMKIAKYVLDAAYSLPSA